MFYKNSFVSKSYWEHRNGLENSFNGSAIEKLRVAGFKVLETGDFIFLCKPIYREKAHYFLL